MARNWKKMSKEEEDKKRQETIDKAIETMNKGIYEYLDSDRFKTLLDTMSKFHDYSMNNTLLILGQNPHATHLAGYNKWQQDFNRQVKRGEKGLMIWMPVEIKVKEKQYVLDEKGNRILGDDGKFKKEEVVVKKHTFKIGYTFDVSQTEQIEGKEVVELSPVKELEGDVKDYQALTKALMEISPVPITIEAFDGTAKGCYNPLTNEIKIQPEMSEVQTIKTMIHEIAHSIVHSNENLDQLKQKENIEFSKSEREVQAESIAYIVSSHLGIDTSDYSFPYVATWGLSTEPSDLENVKQNLKCIKSTSFDLTSKIDTYMEQLQAQQEQNKVNVQIAINWSENGTVAQYSEESNIAPEDKLSFAEANELLKRMNDHLKDTMLGYDKTDYEITLYKENDADPYVYSGRYDIGSENGDIIDTISHYLDWKIEHENDQNALLFKNDFIPEAEAGRKLSVDEAKRVDKIFDEMLKRELKYKTINFTREHFETVDTARDVMRVEEKMDELYNNGDISGKTHDEVLNHLSEVEENERRENLKIQDIIDAPLKWDSKTKPEGAFIGMTVSDFVFSHGLHQNMKLNDFNELLAKEGYSTFPNKQYPFTNLERMISDEEFKLDVLNISNNLNKIYDETDFVYEKGIEESDVAEVVFDGICDDYELSRLVNKCEGKDQLKDFVEHCEDIQGLFVNAVEMEIQEMEI